MTADIRPRDQSAGEFARVKVDLLSPHGVLLRCQVCGSVWSAWVRSQGFTPNYWRCPKGCNGGDHYRYDPWKHAAGDPMP